MSLSSLPSSSTLLLPLAPVFPPIHPLAFYSSKGVEEFAAKINEFIFTHHPSSLAAWGRAVQLMTVEEGEMEACRHSQRIHGMSSLAGVEDMWPVWCH